MSVSTVDLFCVGRVHSKSLREPLGILGTWAIPATWATALAFLRSRSPSRWRHLWEALVAQATPAAWGPYLTGERWRIFDPYKKHVTLKISQIWQKFSFWDGTEFRRSRKNTWKETDFRPPRCSLLQIWVYDVSLHISLTTYHHHHCHVMCLVHFDPKLLGMKFRSMGAVWSITDLGSVPMQLPNGLLRLYGNHTCRKSNPVWLRFLMSSGPVWSNSMKEKGWKSAVKMQDIACLFQLVLQWKFGSSSSLLRSRSDPCLRQGNHRGTQLNRAQSLIDKATLATNQLEPPVMLYSMAWRHSARAPSHCLPQ